MKALFLCAGFGTRLGAAAQGRPKALLPVCEKPLIDHLLEPLHATGKIEAFHLVTNAHFAPQFERWAQDTRARGIDVQILNDGATSNANRLGATRDLALAVEKHSLRGPLLVAAGDNLFDFPLTEFLDDHTRRPRSLVVTKHESDTTVLRRTGVAELGPEGRLLRLHEKPDEPPSSLSCPALYILSQAALESLPTFLEESTSTDAPGHFISWLAEHQEVFTHLMHGDRKDIGDPEGYREADAWMKARRP